MLLEMCDGKLQEKFLLLCKQLSTDMDRYSKIKTKERNKAESLIKLKVASARNLGLLAEHIPCSQSHTNTRKELLKMIENIQRDYN